MTGIAAAPPVDTDSPIGGTAIEARGLSAGYLGQPVIHDVTMSVRPGEVVALLGPNGAGKSTTMRALCGDLRPFGGSVHMRGEPATGNLAVRARAGLAYIPQDRSVAMGLRAVENARVGRGRAQAPFEMFPELAPHANRRTGLLSGGQQQMLIVGRALGANPFLLLADELSIGLAPALVSRILETIRATARERGVAVLFVEQRVQQALSFADRAYVMRNGRIALEGSSAELLGDLSQVEQLYLR